MAVERMKSCNKITALAKELGIERRLLYWWREEAEGGGSKEGAPKGEARQRRPGLERGPEIDELKRLLAEKALEADFFKGALQKIAARRRNNTKSGETASSTKSGS
jgi:transposase-like protein